MFTIVNNTNRKDLYQQKQHNLSKNALRCQNDEEINMHIVCTLHMLIHKNSMNEIENALFAEY